MSDNPRHSLRLLLSSKRYGICRLGASQDIPEWACKSPFFSITRTTEELSLVCLEKDIPDEIRSEKGWRTLKVAGPLDFSLTGILAAIAEPLAHAGISIFALSTFDTDYILVKEASVERAVEELRCAGHSVRFQ